MKVAIMVFFLKEAIKGMYPKWDEIGLLRHKTLNGIWIQSARIRKKIFVENYRRSYLE